MGLVEKIGAWADRKREEALLQRCGGIQTCPWCRRIVQSNDGWSLKEWDRSPFFDVLTCGACGGTSLWRFELCMVYMAPLLPPEPAFKAKIDISEYLATGDSA